eukprot:364464-Chlamydomonas_euryale.AAC.12
MTDFQRHAAGTIGSRKYACHTSRDVRAIVVKGIVPRMPGRCDASLFPVPPAVSWYGLRSSAESC